MRGGTLRLCLVGSGIAASPSPAMHEAAMRACNLTGTYELRELSAADVPGFIAELRSGRYRGCNVTVPLKSAMAAHCDRLRGDAETLGVVNTIAVEGRALVGDNTDSHGFELALASCGLWPPPDSTALVLGAGGAAAAVGLALSRVRRSSLQVAARRPDAARALARRLRGDGDVRVVAWDAEALRDAGEGSTIVVNATSAGLAELPFDPRCLPPDCAVADVRYRPRPVDVVAAARETGHRAVDGVEMLLQQGLLSFALWTGAAPPVAGVREALQHALGA